MPGSHPPKVVVRGEARVSEILSDPGNSNMHPVLGALAEDIQQNVQLGLCDSMVWALPLSFIAFSKRGILFYF